MADEVDDLVERVRAVAEGEQRVEIVGPVNEATARGDQVLVKRGEDYFVVSSAVAPYTGFETLVFPADADGKVTDWCEVAGGRGMTRETAIMQLELGVDHPPD